MSHAFIIGYGRAGKRLMHLLETSIQFIVPVSIDPDPARAAMYRSLEAAVAVYGSPEIVIIATPPDSHLDYLEWAMKRNAYVLVEKPLCGIGQYDRAKELSYWPEAHRVMVGYNYRFNPLVEKWLGDYWHIGSDSQLRTVATLSIQQRAEWPAWGLALDHLPHTLDILQFVFGQVEINDFTETTTAEWHEMILSGYAAGYPLNIYEKVTKCEVKRVAKLEGPQGCIDVLPENMFSRMMMHFLIAYRQRANIIRCSFIDALKTQALLEGVLGVEDG